MEDGPPGPLSMSERLTLLRRRQNAWDNLEASSREEVKAPQHIKWHLYGGVLALARKPDSITFTQLPSVFRNIQKREWTIDGIGFAIEEFKVDPSQDLLMMIQSPSK